MKEWIIAFKDDVNRMNEFYYDKLEELSKRAH